jgi:hypothetical protein
MPHAAASALLATARDARSARCLAQRINASSDAAGRAFEHRIEIFPPVRRTSGDEDQRCLAFCRSTRISNT